MNLEIFSVEYVEPDPGKASPMRNIEVRERRGKFGGHIPPSINPFHSHFDQGIKTLKSVVYRDGPSLHYKCCLNIGVLSPEHWAMVWTVCAINGMWRCSLKHLLCHLSSPFLLVKVRDPIHPSLDRILNRI